MLRSAMLVLLCAMIVLAGCQPSTKPKTVSSISPDGQAKVVKARLGGQYQLFAFQTSSGAEAKTGEPLATHQLRRGDTVGFRSDANGLRAVAGDQSMPLAPGHYLWEMRADKGQVDNRRTGAMVVLVGGTVAFMVLIASIW
jgi:hypothetical protein